jgi:hypothetical protein
MIELIPLSPPLSPIRPPSKPLLLLDKGIKVQTVGGGRIHRKKSEKKIFVYGLAAVLRAFSSPPYPPRP